MIFTLCGSGRFEPWFHTWNQILALCGHPVFGLSCYPSLHGGVKDWYTPEAKAVLDDVHFQKINASDAVFVLNFMGYIGESTMNEIQYARLRKKRLFFLESWGKGNGVNSGGNLKPEYLHAAKKYDLIGTHSPIDTFYPNGEDIFNDTAILGEGGPRRSSLIAWMEQRDAEAMA